MSAAAGKCSEKGDGIEIIRAPAPDKATHHHASENDAVHARRRRRGLYIACSRGNGVARYISGNQPPASRVS